MAIASSAVFSVVGPAADATYVQNLDTIWLATAIKTSVITFTHSAAIILGRTAHYSFAVDARAIIATTDATFVECLAPNLLLTILIGENTRGACFIIAALARCSFVCLGQRNTHSTLVLHIV